MIKKNIFFLFFLILGNNLYAANTNSGLTGKLSAVSSVSPSLAQYLTDLAKNLNDFVVVGFIIVCVTSAISMLFTSDNVVKVLSKVAFGLFLLKGAVAAIVAICKI